MEKNRYIYKQRINRRKNKPTKGLTKLYVTSDIEKKNKSFLQYQPGFLSDLEQELKKSDIFLCFFKITFKVV